MATVQNSNLVLTAETRTRDAAEPSGEPETLVGRLKKMGDRVQYGKPEGLDERKTKKKKCALALLHGPLTGFNPSSVPMFSLDVFFFLGILLLVLKGKIARL